MAGDELLQFLAHCAATGLGAVAMNHHRKRVDGLLVDEDLHLDEVVRLIAGKLVVEARVPFRHRFKPVMEIEDDFVQRQVIDHHGTGTRVAEVFLNAAAVVAELQDIAKIVVRHENGGPDARLLDVVDGRRVGHVRRIVEIKHGPVAQLDMVDHRRRGRDEFNVVLAFNAVTDDLKVQKAEEAAAEAEAQGGGGLHLEGEARVVEGKLPDGVAEILEFAVIDRKEAAKDDGLRRLEAGKRLRRGAALMRDRVADAGVPHLLDRRREDADLARTELRGVRHFGLENGEPVDAVPGAGLHHDDLVALADRPVDDPDHDDHAKIGIVA